MWFKQTVARYGWPGDRVVLSTNDADAAATTPLIAMVLSCASCVGDETVSQWAANGVLFTSSQPQGHMPGEGAVGLLLTNQANLAETATIALLIADTGHRSSRVRELMAHVSARLPALDEAEVLVRVGAGSGTCDAVQFLTALALGRHYVQERGAPILCVSNEDPCHRAVTLIRTASYWNCTIATP